jgi:hypothetical protein
VPSPPIRDVAVPTNSRCVEDGNPVRYSFVNTPYHSLYWATALTLRGSGMDRLSQSIASARVDLNPHQVDGALSAIPSLPALAWKKNLSSSLIA